MHGTVKSSIPVDLLSLDDAIDEIANLSGNGKVSRTLLQCRQFVPGERCFKTYRDFLDIDSDECVVNVDVSAKRDFLRSFYDLTNTDTDVHYTNLPLSSIPILGNYIGRNHIRMFIIGNTAYVSCFDMAEPSFDRDEIFIKVVHPDMVSRLHDIAMWDYSGSEEVLEEEFGDYMIVFDTGKSQKGYLSRYAEEKIKNRAGSNSILWIASSWYPDELEEAVNIASINGSEVNLLINREYEYEGLDKLQFNCTKITAKRLFRSKTRDAKYTVYQPRTGQSHGKFICMENDGEYWWMVGTTNHTKFGSIVKTSEIALSGSCPIVYQEIQDYIESIDTFVGFSSARIGISSGKGFYEPTLKELTRNLLRW